jgi:hypothetical protein
LPCGALPIEAGHLGGGGGLIDEDKLFRIKDFLFFPQRLTGRDDVGLILFGRVYFFKGQVDVAEEPGNQLAHLHLSASSINPICVWLQLESLVPAILNLNMVNEVLTLVKPLDSLEYTDHARSIAVFIQSEFRPAQVGSFMERKENLTKDEVRGPRYCFPARDIAPHVIRDFQFPLSKFVEWPFRSRDSAQTGL